MINKMIETQFGKSCAEFWAKYPANNPLTTKTLSDWKRGFKKHGKFNKNGGSRACTDGKARWEKGSSLKLTNQTVGFGPKHSSLDLSQFICFSLDVFSVISQIFWL